MDRILKDDTSRFILTCILLIIFGNSVRHLTPLLISQFSRLFMTCPNQLIRIGTVSEIRAEVIYVIVQLELMTEDSISNVANVHVKLIYELGARKTCECNPSLTVDIHRREI
jgi:hypothetical protein